MPRLRHRRSTRAPPAFATSAVRSAEPSSTTTVSIPAPTSAAESARISESKPLSACSSLKAGMTISTRTRTASYITVWFGYIPRDGVDAPADLVRRRARVLALRLSGLHELRLDLPAAGSALEHLQRRPPTGDGRAVAHRRQARRRPARDAADPTRVLPRR